MKVQQTGKALESYRRVLLVSQITALSVRAFFVKLNCADNDFVDLMEEQKKRERR